VFFTERKLNIAQIAKISFMVKSITKYFMLKATNTRPTLTLASCPPPVQMHAADGNSNDADREMPASNLQNDDKFIHDIERQSEEVCAPVVLHKVTDTNRLHSKHNRCHTISKNQS